MDLLYYFCDSSQFDNGSVNSTFFKTSFGEV